MCPGPLTCLTPVSQTTKMSSCTHAMFGRSGGALWYMWIFVVFITCVYTQTLKLLTLIGIFLLTFPVFFHIQHQTRGYAHFKQWWRICYWFYISQICFNYLSFQPFDFEHTWWRLFQKRVVRIQFDIYVFIAKDDSISW